MLNYKECSIEDFNNAMKNKDADIESVSSEHLYILYTKFKSDAEQCLYVGKTYSIGIGKSSENRAKIYKNELLRRGLM